MKLTNVMTLRLSVFMLLSLFMLVFYSITIFCLGTIFGNRIIGTRITMNACNIGLDTIQKEIEPLTKKNTNTSAGKFEIKKRKK